jgi:primosomal protein N' (replication factor Y)
VDDRVIRVAVPVPLRREFEFLVDESALQPWSVQIGARVIVPFGRRKLTGVVTATDCVATVPAGKLKLVETLLDEEPVFTPPLLRALIWAATYYHAPPGELLSAALPKKLRMGAPVEPPRETQFSLTEAGKKADLSELKNAPLQRKIMAVLGFGEMAGTGRPELAETGVSWRSAVQRLVKREWVVESYR